MPRLTETNLNDAILRNAKPQVQRYDLYDARVRGLGLRVATSGTKSWFVMRRVKGRMTRKTFGRYPALSLTDARRMATGLVADMARGLVDDRPSDYMFDAAVEEWLQRDQGKNRTVRQVRNALNLYVMPTLSRRKLHEVSKADVIRIIDKIMDRGAGVSANRVLAYLRRFFTWTIERDLLQANPTAGIPKPFQETSRDRVLSIEELARVNLATESMGYPFGPLIQMLLLTGQRRDEVAHAVWDEFDLSARRWTITSNRAKNGHQHVVHLSVPVLDLLNKLPRIDGQHYLFSTIGTRPFSGFSAAKKRLDRTTGISDWTLHDLRRSFATHCREQLGISPVVIDKVLNHQSGAVRGIAAVYQRGAYLEQRRDALDAWGKFITSTMNLPPDLEKMET
jgi:integrase